MDADMDRTSWGRVMCPIRIRRERKLVPARHQFTGIHQGRRHTVQSWTHSTYRPCFGCRGGRGLSTKILRRPVAPTSTCRRGALNDIAVEPASVTPPVVSAGIERTTNE